MFDASGNRLPKSGKIIVTSVDLKVQDAKTKRFRTFRPTFEVAYLGIDEMVILGYDWFSETTERIVVGPPVLRTAAKGRLGLQWGIVYYKSTRYRVRQVVAQGAKGKRRNKQKYMNRIVCLAKLSLR